MPRGEMSLEMYEGAPDHNMESLPEGLDFGNDFEATDDEDASDDQGTDTNTDADAESGDAAGDDGDSAGDSLDDTDAGDEADAEADADAEPDADAADEEPAPAAKEKNKEPKIPKSRLDQSIRKQRLAEQRTVELETELAELRRTSAEAARPKPLTSEQLQAKFAEANEALIGGDTEKAAALQAELFSAMAPQPAEQTERAAPVDLAAEVEERIEFKAMVKDVYARFPELDENNDLFDEELASESVSFQKGYLDRGFSMVEATRKAADAVAKLNDLEDRKAEKAPAPSGPSKDKVLQDAKTKAKVAKATKAPPPMSGTVKGEGSDKVNINDLNADEFMALPESVRNKMLGMTL